MARLILARHGETAWNVESICRGRSEVNLNAEGIRQAELLGKYFSNWKLDAIYSSPLRRALDTANAVARYQKARVHVVQALTDLDFGQWQARSEKELRRLYPALLDEWYSNPGNVEMPGGEGLGDVRRRAMRLVNRIVSSYKGNVLLISHRVVIIVLICYLLGLDNSHFWNVSQDVGGITVFDYTYGRFTLIRHNDTCHLRALQESGLDDS